MADKAKQVAKKFKLKTGGGTDIEGELADEELGIDEKDDKKPAAPSRKIKGNGASVVQFTVDAKDAAELLVSKMFKNLLIADSQITNNNFQRMYMNFKKMTTDTDAVKVRVITADDRVPALIRFIQKHDPNDEHKELSPDIIATRLIGGSKEYIKWVKDQTKHKDIT